MENIHFVGFVPKLRDGMVGLDSLHRLSETRFFVDAVRPQTRPKRVDATRWHFVGTVRRQLGPGVVFNKASPPGGGEDLLGRVGQRATLRNAQLQMILTL